MGVDTGNSTTTAPVVVPNPPPPPPAATGAGPPMSPQQFAAQQIAKSQSTLDQYMNYLQTNMGRVNYAAAGKSVAGELGAEVSPLLSQIQGQEKTGAQAISGYTSQLATNLAGIQPGVQAAYSNAEQQQAAIDSALSAQLSGAGGQQAANLGATLAARGQDTSVAQDVAQQAQGYAGASLATGSAALSQLVSQGAAAGAYGAQLPGIAALAGYQALGNLQSDTYKQQQTVLADAQKQYPTLLNQAINQQLNVQKNTAAGLYNVAKTSGTNAKTAVGAYLGSVADSLKKPPTVGSPSTGGVFQYDSTTGKWMKVVNGVTKPVVGKVVGSDRTGRELIDPSTGRVIAKLTGPVASTTIPKPPPSEAKKHGITTYEMNRYHGDSVGIVEGAFTGGQFNAQKIPTLNGGYNANGVKTPPLSRADVINHLDQQGIPSWVYLPVVNSVYNAGGSRSTIQGPPTPKGK